MNSKLSLVAACALIVAFVPPALSQSAPDFDNIPFANDTSWAAVEIRGGAIAEYGPHCIFALQMDIRVVTISTRELVIQTACENRDATEINYIVPEGQSSAITNFSHSDRHFYDISQDGREIRIVRVYASPTSDGISHNRVRIRVNSREDAYRGRIFWEIRQNGQWRELVSAELVRLRDHNVLRLVPDTFVGQVSGWADGTRTGVAEDFQYESSSVGGPRRRAFPLRPTPLTSTGMQEGLMSAGELADAAVPLTLCGPGMEFHYCWVTDEDERIRLMADDARSQPTPDRYPPPVPGLHGRPPQRSRH